MFSISLDLYFFILLSLISIYTVNRYKDIKNILLFKYFRKNKKYKQMFGPANLEFKADSVNPSGIEAQPFCLGFTR